MHSLPFFREVPYLYVLQGAFTIWMLVDCYRRGAETFWFWIILFFPGFGAWVYFFAVKARDFRGGINLPFWPFQSRTSTSELRYRVDHSPTLTNQLALGERLIEEGQHAEAVPYLQAVLQREPDNCVALYWFAACQTELNQPEEAVANLQKIVGRDRRWGGYKAWHLLREAQVRMGDGAGALASCQELARLSPTLQHKCLLAQQFLARGEPDVAYQVLEKSLEEYEYWPGPSRRRNRRWARQARHLQKQITQMNNNRNSKS